MATEVGRLGSFSICFRRGVLERLDSFSEEYGVSTEDADLSYRARKCGYRLGSARSVTVGHYRPTNLYGYLQTQGGYGSWRMKLYSDHPDPRGRDGYTRATDLVQPPLFLLLTALLPLLWVAPIRWAVLALAMLGLLLHVPATVYATRHTKHVRHLAMIPIFFLHGFAWAWGALWGLLAFWLPPRREDTDRVRSDSAARC